MGHPITLSRIMLFEKTLILLVVILGSALGIPQMEECPNGPCAVMFGPCVADTDCIGDNMVCSDKMESCNPLSMITPCCNMGTVVQAALASEDLTTLVAAVKPKLYFRPISQAYISTTVGTQKFN